MHSFRRRRLRLSGCIDEVPPHCVWVRLHSLGPFTFRIGSRISTPKLGVSLVAEGRCAAAYIKEMRTMLFSWRAAWAIAIWVPALRQPPQGGGTGRPLRRASKARAR